MKQTVFFFFLLFVVGVIKMLKCLNRKSGFNRIIKGYLYTIYI